MAGNYQLAGEAIGAVVRHWQPASQHNWGNVIPETSWGMELAAWDQMLGEIVAEFSALIAPQQIQAGAGFDGSHKKELYKLQRRLADSVQ
jgi:hypothetical protein